MKASDKLSIIKTDKYPESGYVYLISAIGTDRFKIGKAKDVVERVSQIQGAAPLKIRYVFHCYVGDNYKTERELHKIFADKRVIGEWFRFSENDIKEVILLMKLVHEQEPNEQQKAKLAESELIDEFLTENPNIAIEEETEQSNTPAVCVVQPLIEIPTELTLPTKKYTTLNLTKTEVIATVSEMRSKDMSDTKIIEQLWKVKKSAAGWSRAYREYKKELGL